MPENIKEKIWQFLKDNKGKKYSVLKIKKEIGHSYNVILKWVTVLVAEKDRNIVMEDFGNVKPISYVGD